MLEVQAEKLGRVTILHFQGRIVAGIATTTLREAVFAQIDANEVVVNLAHADLIDAAGLGALLELREWAQSKRIEFKLMNVNARIQQVLEITCLDSVFEITSRDAVLTAPTGRNNAAVALPLESTPAR
jgi:anti-anti-sigma factor